MSKQNDENARLGVRLLVLKDGLVHDTPEAMKEFFGTDVFTERDFSKCWSETIREMPKERLEYYMQKYRVDETLEEVRAESRYRKTVQPIRDAFAEVIKDDEDFGKWWLDAGSLSDFLDQYYVLKPEHAHLIDEWVAKVEGDIVDKTCKKFGFLYSETPEDMKPFAELVLKIVKEELYDRANTMLDIEEEALFYEDYKEERE